jgi:hypothetical protein
MMEMMVQALVLLHSSASSIINGKGGNDKIAGLAENDKLHDGW